MAEERVEVMLIILITVIVLSLIGNILVVVISLFCIRLRSLTIIFIFNIALSDLLLTVGLVFWICKQIWGLPHGACRVVTILFAAGFYSNSVFLVLLSVQHYITVVHPHTGWKKGHWIIHVVICVWIMSFSAALPATELCIYETALLATIYKENIIFMSTFLFMAFCYIRILQTILKSPTNQRHRTTGLAFLLVVTFFICWAPSHIGMFLCTLPYLFSAHLCHAQDMYTLLACAQCCLNPVIYSLYALKFRKTAQKIFHRRANLNSAQMATDEHHYDSLVNNQVSKMDRNHDAVLTVTTAINY